MLVEKITVNKANEAVSKFKLLSAYGGPGSIIHTSYGSIIISCIEEWGFITKVLKIRDDAITLNEANVDEYVTKHAMLNEIEFSNDMRLLDELKSRKEVENLKYLVLIPDIDLNDTFNTIKDSKTSLAISSTFMPKGFFDKNNHYKNYYKWYDEWPGDKALFFPPKYSISSKSIPLKQDNIVLICREGHISDFPWSKFLRWRIESPQELYNEVPLFDKQDCCQDPIIQITDTSANASGFDGKWIRCNNKGCQFGNGVSLKGIMSLKVCCPGHSPWEANTGEPFNYYGNPKVRKQSPPSEPCSNKTLNLALTTGNNLYFSRVLSSLYMPVELFLDPAELEIRKLNAEFEEAKRMDDFERCIDLKNQIKEIKEGISTKDSVAPEESEREQIFRFQEFNALSKLPENEINLSPEGLKVKDVTENLNEQFSSYFSRILRVDNLKVTSAQLDFSRVEPFDADSTEVKVKNIFRSNTNDVLVYPVVENFGEGIFFAFDGKILDQYLPDTRRYTILFNRQRNKFASGALSIARRNNWQLYLIHTFSHIIMRELEFRCGYPTASLSERLYVSNDDSTKMYGFMVYTAEGAEGSMGGLIAQTRFENLNSLLESALKRATICNSDPLCWMSDGQGLFELNLAACFSCGLVSETSCEHRNLYLDRRILVDEEFGFFKDII